MAAKVEPQSGKNPYVVDTYGTTYTTANDRAGNIVILGKSNSIKGDPQFLIGAGLALAGLFFIGLIVTELR